MLLLDGYHATRFAFDSRRDLLWKILCESYFQKYVPLEGCVLELGAGYGNFINNIICENRIAIDKWEGCKQFVSEYVRLIVGDVTDLSKVKDNYVDFAFASNLFEHLTKDELSIVLTQLRTKLKPNGTLNILQPNYRFAYREYFDDYTHKTVYSDRSLSDFIESHGYKVIECLPRFLPLTLKSKFPVYPILIRLYLWSPFKFKAKQMLVRAMID